MSRNQSRQEAERVILQRKSQKSGQLEGSVFPPDSRQDISIIGELLRKLTHIAAISIPIMYYFTSQRLVLTLLAGGFSVFLAGDLLRFFGHDRTKSLINRYFGLMIRPREKSNFSGATYILASSILTILIFDKSIAILAIAYIVVGDTAGAIVGRIWGRNRFRNKTLEGSASFFVACCIVALIVPGVPWWVKIAGAFIATIVEAFTIYMDDNLTVPLISGGLMQLIVSQSVPL
ncbi:MAG: diacylglycerol/polyprenol kinase family protein [candidate division Zixibacteria bacterium]